MFKAKLAALVMAAFLAVGPAMAHHKEDHDGGRPDDGGKPGVSQVAAPEKDDGPQGKSPSRPDQDGIGADHGIVNDDKVHDGNNGCGNDPDREDDNNGHCGKPSPRPSPSPSPSHPEPKPSPSPSPTVPSPSPSDTPSPTPTPEGPDEPEKPRPTGPPDDVLGSQTGTPRAEDGEHRMGTAGSRLPATGEDIKALVLVGGLLFLLGLGTCALEKSFRQQPPYRHRK